MTGDQIGELKSAVSELETRTYDEIDDQVLYCKYATELGMINTNTGVNVYNSVTYRSSFIERAKYNIVRKSADYIANIFGYDAEKTYIGYTAITAGPNVDMDVPDNYVYYRITFKNRNNTLPEADDGMIVLKYTWAHDLLKSLDPIDTNAFADSLKNLFSDETGTFTEIEITYLETEGYYSKSNGVFTAYSNVKASDFIDVHQYKKLRFSGGSWSSSAAICFYNENHSFISSLGDGTIIYSNTFIDLPDNTYYVTVNDNHLRSSKPAPSLAYLYAYGLTIDSLKRYAGKKWVCLGDSLTEYNGATTKHYFDFIAEKTGITIVNLGDGGTGYMNDDAGRGTTFYNRIDQIPIDADVITIFGSGNDVGYVTEHLGTVSDTGTDTLCGCINTTLDNIFTRIPLAIVGIVAPTPWHNYPPYSAGNNMQTYTATLKAICERRGIPFLDLYHNSLLRPWEASFREEIYPADGGTKGIHPNAKGHEMIAPRFEAFLDTLLLH